MKLQKFRDGFGRVVLGVGYLGLAFLFVMVVIVAVDVILRKATGGALRIDGSNEVTALSMVVVCSLWIPALQLKRGHIWVTLFVDKFPYRFRCFWLFGITAIETAVIAMLVIGSYRRVIDLLSTGRQSDVLGLPWWLFAVVVLIAFIEYFVISLIDTIQFCVDGMQSDTTAPGGKNFRLRFTRDGWTDDDVKGI